MSEYHKINSLYKRDMTKKPSPFIIGEWTCPEFEYLQNNTWEFTEKVDGTNIRVIWDGSDSGDMKVYFAGKTDRAQMPAGLFQRLVDMFPPEKLEKQFGGTPAILYGEGYGARIQKGGGDYISDDVSFILFDVKIGHWWLQRQDVDVIAKNLCILSVPIIGHGTLHDAIKMCTEGFTSTLKQLRSKNPRAEGLVCRPEIELKARNGERIITKVKLCDFGK